VRPNHVAWTRTVPGLLCALALGAGAGAGLAAPRAAEAQVVQIVPPSDLGGLGMLIARRQGHIVVVRVMPGSAAERAGVRRGDRIHRIEDERTRGMALQRAVDLIRGPPGTRLRLWVRRAKPRGGFSHPVLIRAVREPIRWR
jgi:C-terminal processing protease CtpA/Prc